MHDSDVINFSSFSLEVSKNLTLIKDEGLRYDGKRRSLLRISYHTAFAVKGSSMAFHTYHSNLKAISDQIKHRLRRKSIFIHIPYQYEFVMPKHIRRRRQLVPSQRFLYRYDSFELPFTSNDHDLWTNYFKDKDLQSDSGVFYNFNQPLTFFLFPFAHHLRVLKLL